MFTNLIMLSMTLMGDLRNKKLILCMVKNRIAISDSSKKLKSYLSAVSDVLSSTPQKIVAAA